MTGQGDEREGAADRASRMEPGAGEEGAAIDGRRGGALGAAARGDRVGTAGPDGGGLRPPARLLTTLLARGDLTCELCDAGLAAAAAGSWPVAAGVAAFAGPARTVDAGTGDVAAVRAAAAALLPGEVLVVAAERAVGAVFGERLAALAASRGAVGAVLDGLVRDLPRLPACGLPVRARGVHPARAEGEGSATQDGTVCAGGVEIAPGDLVVVDANGVVAVAAARRAALETTLAALAAAEG